MAVVSLIDPHSPLARFGDGQPDSCSYCALPLADPVTHWHCGVRLWLHPDCSHTLALNLLYDAQRARRIADGQPVLSGINWHWRITERAP